MVASRFQTVLGLGKMGEYFSRSARYDRFYTKYYRQDFSWLMRKMNPLLSPRFSELAKNGISHLKTDSELIEKEKQRCELHAQDKIIAKARGWRFYGSDSIINLKRNIEKYPKAPNPLNGKAGFEEVKAAFECAREEAMKSEWIELQYGTVSSYKHAVDVELLKLVLASIFHAINAQMDVECAHAKLSSTPSNITIEISAPLPDSIRMPEKYSNSSVNERLEACVPEGLHAFFKGVVRQAGGELIIKKETMEIVFGSRRKTFMGRLLESVGSN